MHYVRWQLTDGKYDTQLLLSKNRLARPLKTMSIDRIELCGAVISKRLRKTITTECRYKFERIYHIVDSQIVHAMIRKETYGFNTFAATRVREIQQGTNVSDWHWIPGEYNIADWLTRGKSPKNIGMDSVWQKGPAFLMKPENEWPTSQYIIVQPLPDTIDFLKSPSFLISGSGGRPAREGLLSLAARQIYRRNFPPVGLIQSETVLLTRRQSNWLTPHET